MIQLSQILVNFLRETEISAVVGARTDRDIKIIAVEKINYFCAVISWRSIELGGKNRLDN